MAPLAMSLTALPLAAAARFLPDFHFGDEVGLGVAGAALILGATSSLHCFLMCGPLACTAIDVPVGRLLPSSAAARRRAALRAAVGYHLARVVGYSVAGGVLGAIPALLAAQLHTRLAERLPSTAAHLVRRAIPAVAAMVLVYRAVVTSSGPSCH